MSRYCTWRICLLINDSAHRFICYWDEYIIFDRWNINRFLFFGVRFFNDQLWIIFIFYVIALRIHYRYFSYYFFFGKRFSLLIECLKLGLRQTSGWMASLKNSTFVLRLSIKDVYFFRIWKKFPKKVQNVSNHQTVT